MASTPPAAGSLPDSPEFANMSTSSLSGGLDPMSGSITKRSPSMRTQPLSRSYYYDASNHVGGSPAKPMPGNVISDLPYQVKICSGNCNPKLASQVADILGLPLIDLSVTEAASGAVQVKLKESVASHDVYVIQPCGKAENGNDLNTSLMELLFLIRRLKLARAARVTAVVPYFPYSRQDRKTELRAPLSASAVAQMLTTMGVDRVVTLDLHSGQVQGTFQSVPLDNLWMYQEFAQCLRERLPLHEPETLSKIAIVSPDAGGVVRARKLADILRVNQVVTIMKRRQAAGKVDTMQTVGDVEGYTCIIVDDMVDTGGTLAKACELLKSLGATAVYACCTHGVLSDPACKTLSNCAALKEIMVSDSLPQASNLTNCRKLRVLPIAPMLAHVISRHHNEQSVSTLFNAPTPKSQASPPGEGTKFPSIPLLRSGSSSLMGTPPPDVQGAPSSGKPTPKHASGTPATAVN